MYESKVAHVDSNTLATKATRSTDAMDVIFTVPVHIICHNCYMIGQAIDVYVRRKVIVDYEGHLLHVDAPSPYIGSDKYSAGGCLY
jgi:hypothetical protein